MKAIGFYPLFNMRKHEIAEVKKQFAFRGFHYVGTARSIEEMKSLKALHDIRLIAISGFARWEPMTKIQFVRAKSLKQQWFHVDGGDYRILESLKQEMGMER